MKSAIPNLKSLEAREQLPLSLLNDYLYCPRRAALKVVEGWRWSNEHTNRGDTVHEHADLAGYEVVKGVTLLRALPVWSERLGLNGKCDVVEVELRSASTNLKSQISDLKSAGIASLRLVEFKLGKRRQWENDDAQLCAQALCREEMFNVGIARGAIFHADSKRRREVKFTADLRLRTEQAVSALYALLQDQTVPPAELKPARKECSLFDICQPKVAESRGRMDRTVRQLFQI